MVGRHPKNPLDLLQKASERLQATAEELLATVAELRSLMRETEIELQERADHG